MALARRGLVANLRGYLVDGDFRRQSPPAALIEAVGRGEVDVAVAWGPLAGSFAALALRLVPLPSGEAAAGLPFAFDIAVAVRPDDQPLRAELDAALARRAREVHRLLLRYRFPVAPRE
jgi:mxaJ protein